MGRIKGGCCIAAFTISAFSFSACEQTEKEKQAIKFAQETSERLRQERERMNQEEEFRKKIREFRDFSPPNKITKTPYFKGKGSVIRIRFEDGSKTTPGWETASRHLTEFEILSEEQRAQKIEEVETMIQIDCRQGGKIGNYEFYPAGEVAIYANVCQVSIIDYTIPAVIAKKTFENREVPETKELSKFERKYLPPPPKENIREFLKNLPRK